MSVVVCCARIAFSLAVGFSALVSTSGGQSSTDFKLPSPEGKYSVGRTTIAWIDATRSMRPIKADIWYPAKSSDGPVSQYFPHLDALLRNSETRPAVTARYGPALRGLLEGKPRSNSHDDAPISDDGKPFPLLLFSPGLGGSPYDYSIQMEDLASYGNIVVAIEHVNDTLGVVLPTGKVLPYDGQLWNRFASTSSFETVKFYEERAILWAKDLLFALEQCEALSLDTRSPFYDAIDLNRVGAFGHSHGGRSAATACILDSRITACLNEDGRLDEDQLQRPYWTLPGGKFRGAFAMLDTFDPGLDRDDFAGMHTTLKDYAAAKTRPTDAALEVYRGAGGGAVHFTMLQRGMNHIGFTDLPWLTASSEASRAGQRERLSAVCKIARMFFDEQFNKNPRGENGCSAADSETLVECYRTKEK
jgi:hypothetical protein